MVSPDRSIHNTSVYPAGRFNIWGSEVRKKEKAYEDEKYAAACRYMLSVTCDDEDDYIPLAITPDLPIEEPDNSLKMGDEHLDTIPATESDEVIKSSVENLSELVESLINHDTSIVHSSKIDPILEEFAGELAHIAPIPPGIVEADFDSNDDTSSDDDDFEDIEYVSLEEVNDVDQGEKEFNLEDIFQIQDVILREKLLNRSYGRDEKWQPQHKLIYISSEYESFHFDNPSFPRPPPEPPDVEICLNFESDTPVIDNFEELNEDQREGENVVFLNVEEDDSFTFTIRTFLPFLTYPEVSPLSCSTGSEDLIFDPGIITFHFLKPLAFLWKFLSSIFALPKDN
ncbi:hypothetical protein Tco_1483764 [Tanacetum coccineum]